MMGKLIVIAVGMLGFGYAMVPMYRQICEAIGISQTRVVASGNTQVDTSREVTVELLASSAGLPWSFEAMDRVVKLHPGELTTVRYRVVNTLGRPVTAHAVMNTAPAGAMKWIEKQACFCFSNQTLGRRGVARDAGGVPGEPGCPAGAVDDFAVVHVLRGARDGYVKNAFKAVFWSFFGIRRKSEYEADTQQVEAAARDRCGARGGGGVRAAAVRRSEAGDQVRR